MSSYYDNHKGGTFVRRPSRENKEKTNRQYPEVYTIFFIEILCYYKNNALKNSLYFIYMCIKMFSRLEHLRHQDSMITADHTIHQMQIEHYTKTKIEVDIKNRVDIPLDKSIGPIIRSHPRTICLVHHTQPVNPTVTLNIIVQKHQIVV